MNKLNFVNKTTNSSEPTNNKTWKVLIADDDVEVHSITKTVLKYFEYENASLELLSSYSGKETIEVLKQHDDIAVILLDVVMESNDAGLQVVKFIREDLKNKIIRIVLRTGQPGSAPEKVVINQYEIDDYKEKTELTATKLFTTLLTSLRTYSALNTIEITNKKLYDEQKKLKYSEKLLKNIIDTVPARIFWKDLDSTFLGANKLFLEDAGLNHLSDLVGKKDKDLIWKEYAENFIEDDKIIIDSEIGKINYVEKIFDKDKKEFTISTSKVPLRDENNNTIGVLGIYTDITEKIKIENELKHKETILSQQSKMAAMGEMIENIAHQWRQPLSVITTAASGLQVQKDFDNLTDEILDSSIKEIMKSSNFLSHTIDDFRDYFKPNKEKILINLADIFDKTLNLLNSKFKNSEIKIIKNFEQIKMISLSNELIQVFMIILNNAKEALETKLNDKKIFVDIYKENGDAVIVIKDNAGGISSEIIDRVFEPYFTTKHKAQGTGIGLYMTEEIIVKHLHGNIDVQNIKFEHENNQYKGAAFIIKIPIKME